MSLDKKLFIGSSAGGACPTDSVQPFGAESAYSSNVALYQLDSDGGTTNNVPDTVGNHSGTASNVTYSTGKFGNAATFSGLSSSIVVSNASKPSLSTASVSLWLKTTSTNTQPLVGEGVSGNHWGNLQLYINNNKLVGRSGNASNSNNPEHTSVSNVNTGLWVHCAVTITGNTQKIYINGVLENTATLTVTRAATTNPFSIGQLYVNGSIGGFNWTNDCDIDQVRIYDKALSSDEVEVLYNETTSTVSDTNVLGEGSGVALYSLDYDASDAGGNYGGAATNVTFGVDGQINYGASFNGTSSVIDTNNVFSNNVSKITYSTWVYFDNLNTQNFIMFPDSGAAGNGFGFFDYGNGNIYFQSDNATNSNRGYISNSGLYSTNEWVHFALVFDGTATGNSNRLKAYVNGNLLSLTFSGTIPSTTQSSSYNLLLGSRKTSSLALSGKMDQVRIFNKALSSSEVSTLYGETACVYTSTTDIVNYQGTNLAYYKLDNNALDETTNNYDGAETDITYEFGRFGQAAVFNGSSSYIESGISTNILNSDYTISFWGKSSNSSGSQTFINTASTPVAFARIDYSGNGDLIFVHRNSSGTAYSDASIVSGMADGNWHHVVITKDNTSVKAYKDGNLVGTITSTSGTYSNNTTLQIGRNNYNTNGANNFDGNIDQVRIFDSALDATAVENLYNEKPEINTSNFETVLYEGNAGSQYVSNVGFEPDLVWVKSRTSTHWHQVVDAVRGNQNILYTNGNNEETTGVTNGITSFNSNGFSLGNRSDFNGINQNYVAWCWKAGGDAVNNTNGDITSQVSANQDAGFSIVKYTGSGTSGDSVPHGLNQRPDLIFVKGLDNSRTWMAKEFSTMTSDSNYLSLSSNDEIKTAGSATFIKSTSDSSVIVLGDSERVNFAEDYIAYCFHSVAGYQKVGSYTGNNTTNVVNTGFQPRFVMIKKTSGTGTWFMHDSLRLGTHGYSDKYIQANAPALQEIDSSDNDLLEFTSTGFTLRTTFGDYNQLNGTYIYLAIA